MSYSDVPNQPAGYYEVPISEIKEGDVFTYKGADEIFKATADVRMVEDQYLEVLCETVDFEKKVFRHSKAQLAYAPTYYLVKV